MKMSEMKRLGYGKGEAGQSAADPVAGSLLPSSQAVTSKEGLGEIGFSPGALHGVAHALISSTLSAQRYVALHGLDFSRIPSAVNPLDLETIAALGFPAAEFAMKLFKDSPIKKALALGGMLAAGYLAVTYSPHSSATLAGYVQNVLENPERSILWIYAGKNAFNAISKRNI